jgi:hypothetical protein
MSKRERKPRAQSKSHSRPQQAEDPVVTVTPANASSVSVSAQRQQAVTPTVTSANNVSVSARVIRAAHTKWGSRATWGKVQFVEAELCAIFPGELPPDIKGHDKDLVKNINERLIGYPGDASRPPYAGNAGYKAKYRNSKVNHKTVARALEKLRAG